MHKVEFIEKLSKSYKDGNDLIYDELNQWIDKKELSQFHLISLYDRIKLTYKYKTFPSLAFIHETLCHDFPEFSYEDEDLKRREKELFRSSATYRFREDVKKLSTEDLFIKLHEIFYKENKSVYDMDLWSNYESLYAEYLIMVDLGYDKKRIKDHLKLVHEKILSGGQFRSKFLEAKAKFRKTDDERKDKAQHISEVL